MKKLFIRTAQQQHWQQQLRLLKTVISERAVTVDANSEFPHQSITDLIALHYSSTTLPTSYGGAGFSVYDMVLAQETLASYDANTALAMSWTLGVVGELYEKKLWSEDKRQKFAKEIANGALVNRAVSEASTGSPTRGGRPGTSAVKKGDKWCINGTKIFTTGSPALDYFIVSAWVEEKQEVGNFLIHKDTAGVSIRENWHVISMRGTGSHDLVLNNVLVEADDFVETVAARKADINGWALHIPAIYMGIAQAARDYTLSFAKTHQPNSLQAPICELPNVQAQLGQIELMLDQARFTLYGVAQAYDDPTMRKNITNELAVAKHTVVNLAIEIIDKAMRIVGAKSLQLSNPLQRYYRDVRAGLHNPPMDDMTISKLAQSALADEFEY